ncbi:cell division protein FtsQ/DivIB [Gardnerella vaginalis]|uniref:FtsQ-type POTRA domain-containing protein n=1 Tax=Gardnerella vaginalis TaxID=2702 RepID=A0AAW6Y2W7_GARVA|nr:FtsQ-type POTRA domain-containing protein [Gardnerella vaginalis]MDK7063659.1 FtsQ-type POTRA domain-containing protein [Gardnerella vaginalis]PNP87626.1 cell division protein FtsQ [Gardnerella vaginalis]RFT39899.1 cell division protein FtsQ [Gardnerella vaginalis]RIY23448.1 cell division protein FtsQ [Gardnerella vaginalis]
MGRVIFSKSEGRTVSSTTGNDAENRNLISKKSLRRKGRTAKSNLTTSDSSIEFVTSSVPTTASKSSASSVTAEFSVSGESTKNNASKNTFVDARRLSVVDFVKQTLRSTAGPLGIVSRPKVIDFSAREKEKKFASLRTILLRFLYSFLIIAAITLLCWVLFFSPIFRLKSENISIFGSNEWVSEQKISSIASNQVNKSLFLVSSQEIIEQLNNIPGVTEAKVSKKFPQGLQITVRAQKPAAMLKTHGSEKLTAVDVKGRVLNAVENVPTAGIPVIEVTDVHKSLSSKAVREALKIVSSLSEDFRSHVMRVSARTQDSVETEISSTVSNVEIHRVIVWGDSSDLDLKKAIVDVIINDPSKIGNRQRLDVSAPARPILK